MLGNSILTFDYDDIMIGDEKYVGSPDLYELIFMKYPNESKITKDDIKNTWIFFIRPNNFSLLQR